MQAIGVDRRRVRGASEVRVRRPGYSSYEIPAHIRLVHAVCPKAHAFQRRARRAHRTMIGCLAEPSSTSGSPGEQEPETTRPRPRKPVNRNPIEPPALLAQPPDLA